MKRISKSEMDFRKKYLAALRELRETRDKLERGRQAFNRLRNKHEVAIDKLSNLASGLVPNDLVNERWDVDTKMKVSAARTLKQLIQMPYDVFP